MKKYLDQDFAMLYSNEPEKYKTVMFKGTDIYERYYLNSPVIEFMKKLEE